MHKSKMKTKQGEHIKYKRFFNNNPTISKLRIAFTLAEVLISLAIIGVIAAMVIPTLIDRIQTEQFRSSLKKQYSVLTQAVNTLQAQNGTIDTSSESNLIKDLSTQISIIKIGGWARLSALPSSFYYHCYKNSSGDCSLSGDGNSFISMSTYRGNWAFITKDGATYLLTSGVKANCDGNNYHVKLADSETLPVPDVCETFAVDLNGDKGPNQLGVDMHDIYLLKKNNNYYIRPAGALVDTNCSSAYPDNYNKSLHCTNRMLLGMDMP